MNKEKELVKNTTIIAFGKICTQFVSFFLLPLYTSILNTEEYGTVDLVITYSSLLLPFITLTLEQGLFRFLIDVRNDKEKSGQYIATTVIASSLFSATSLIIVALIFKFTHNNLFIYFGLVLLASAISAVTLQICRGLGDNLGYTLGSTATAITQTICNVVFLVVLRLGAPGMMLALFVGNIACGIIIFIRCDLSSYLKLKYFNKKVFKELSAYSLPLIPNQLSWWVLNACNKVIVQLFIGVAGNGLIAVANKFSSVYIQFSNIFNISWTESATLHIDDKDAETFFSKTINAVYRLFLCTCCIIIVCMPFAFPILINKQYNEAYGLIPIFMIASLFNVVVSLYGVIYVAHKKTVEIAKTAIYAAAVNIISHLILINSIGIYAAALSTAIGYGWMAIYRYFHSRRYIVIKFSKITLLLSAIMLFVSFTSYYSGIKLMQATAFVIILVLSILLNKEMLFGVVNTLKHRIR